MLSIRESERISDFEEISTSLRWETMNLRRYVHHDRRNVKFRKQYAESLPLSWPFLAVSHWIDQWSMCVIQLIKIFDHTDIKQHDPLWLCKSKFVGSMGQFFMRSMDQFLG
jgi:hypothetical protein